ncbi:hypothetical protein EQ500_15175, partial [Lactobacillus sp. XV13L]|nr:hypothetical protein [Lactobacillus sp. XV13L]
MFEKLLVTGYVLFLIAIGKVAPDDHFWTDRINQNIPETVSYAKVSKNSQDHRNVQAIDPATGKKLPYRIKRVGGY